MVGWLVGWLAVFLLHLFFTTLIHTLYLVFNSIADCGLEDLIAAEYRMKAHVGTCRVKAMTMLSIKQLEKKQARIALKPTSVVATS